MKLTIHAALWLGVCSIACTLTSARMGAQTFTTTTVQGTVYLANGRPGSGTLQLSWPAFTTAGNQAVTAGRTNVTIGADGYVSVNLAPNLGSSPAGLYYTAVYHLSDGTTSTEYWVVPAAAQANLSQVRAQVMPAAQAVQAVSKGYVDQSISELTQSLLTASGGSLSGPLFLNGDPAQPTQAATKRYVDSEFSQALPLSGGVVSGPLTSVQLGAAYQVDQFPGADFGAKLQACLNALNGTYGGTCDARNFSGVLAMGSAVTVTTANATVQLPCATIATANQIRITAGTRNVTLHGCALRGASDASGSQGGTVFLYSGPGPMIQVGDPTYTTNTVGFHLDNVVINTTASTNPTAVGFTAFRAQELDLESLYLLGNSNQTGMTLDGTGNYTGGTFQDIEFGGFGTALSAVGHQVSNSATTDWVNASAFLRLHINCPTSGGSPTHGTYGIDLVQGDGNTFTGGDVEGCATALHLGQNAQNNTIVGLRNENSINQVVADAGSSYNNWMTGGTMFTGQLTDNGTRNSFLDTFHRSFNGLNGDWYGSQKDATVTNHYRIGTGTGNERGLLDRYQTDWGYRWTTGLSDATAGAQFYQVLDELNNVYRLSIGQHNPGQPSANDQTVINAAGAGAVVLNGSANAGTGGVIFGAGGASGAAVATINSAGNAQFNGSLQVGGPSTFTNSTTVKNQSDAEIDSVLWAGSTANQKESVIYKDYTGASQWYMVKDATNNWALNSALGGVDSFKAYQSNNSGDTYVNASNSGGHVRLNYETGSGAETDIYSGTASSLVAAFLGTNAIKFPGLASGSGRNCLQIDNSGYISNTGMACGTGNGMNGTVNTGNSGQVAYYVGNGTVIAGTSSVAIGAGGTGATTPQHALQNLGGQPALPGVNSDGASGVTVSGKVAANTTISGQIEGSYQADQHQTGGGNNGIINSASQCAANAYVCAVTAPALYSQVEQVPWGRVNFSGGVIQQASAVPSSSYPLYLSDIRNGLPFEAVINPFLSVYSASPNVYVGKETKVDYSGIPSVLTPGQHYIGYVLNTNLYQGGNVSQLYDFVHQSAENSLSLYTNRASTSQSSGFANTSNCKAPGDCVGESLSVFGPAGFNHPLDEGIELFSNVATETIDVYRGTLTGTPTTGAASVTIAPSSPAGGSGETIAGTQGENRWLILQTPASSFTATAMTDDVQPFACTPATYNNFTSIASSTSVPTSSAWGCLTSAVTVPSGQIIPGVETINVSLTSGSMSTGLACVADENGTGTQHHGNFETINITSVGGGTITANWDKSHPIGGTIWQGGGCGQFAEIEGASLPSGSGWSNGEFGGTTSYPVRFVWPVLGSVDGTNLLLATPRNVFNALDTAFASYTDKTINLFYGAETYKVVGVHNDTTDNVFTLAPNIAPWTSSAAVELTHFPSQYVSVGNFATSQFLPHSGGAHLSLQMYGRLENADTGFSSYNNVANTKYTNWGGAWSLPQAAYDVGGPWQFGLRVNSAYVPGGAIAMPCGASCGTVQRVVNPGNSITQDSFTYTNTNSNGALGLWGVTGYFKVSTNAATTGKLFLQDPSLAGGLAAGMQYGTNVLYINATNSFMVSPDSSTTQYHLSSQSAAIPAGHIVTGTGNANVGQLQDSGVLLSSLPTNAVQVIGKWNTPTANTGSTTATQIAGTSYKVAGSTMGASSQLHVSARYGACTGSGTPFAGCTAANTGTCTPSIYIGSTNTATTYRVLTGNTIKITSPGTADLQMVNLTTSSQLSDGWVLPIGGGSSSGESPTTASAYNTSSDMYLNFFMTNSVSADQCYLTSYVVELIP